MLIAGREKINEAMGFIAQITDAESSGQARRMQQNTA
jgi:hypothetical protein